MKPVRIFDFEDYKLFSLKWIEGLPHRGRGQLQRLAEHLVVHPTLISQIYRRNKDFTSEQACKAAEFFGLSDRESEFFLALVERERAGNSQLKDYWQRRIATLTEENQAVGNRVLPGHKLTREQQIEFYSSWEYSAARLATSIPQLQSIDALSERLGLPIKKTRELIDFLLESGLCVDKRGRISMGPARTHIAAESALSARHHLNWRLKALESHFNLRKHELAFTAPLSIAKKDREKVREILLQTVEKVSALVSDSESEELACLNMDWFDLRSMR